MDANILFLKRFIGFLLLISFSSQLYSQRVQGIRKQITIRIDKDKPYRYLPFKSNGYYVGYSLSYRDSASIAKHYTKTIYRGERPIALASKEYRRKYTDTIITYVPKPPDTTYWIHIFYPSGFSVNFWSFSETLPSNGKDYWGKDLLDTHIVLSYFRNTKTNSRMYKNYLEGFDRGVFEIRGDTLIHQSMVHGNDMFSNWNAGEEFLEITDSNKLKELGVRFTINKNSSVKWHKPEYQTYYKFVECNDLPPDEGWLQKLNWIYK